MNEVKYYYIYSANKVMKFIVQAESKLANGEVCYLATDVTTGNDVWLYKNFIEFCNSKGPNPRIKHTIVQAYETKPNNSGYQFNPYQYMWGQQILDKRTHSMSARPYFFK